MLIWPLNSNFCRHPLLLSRPTVSAMSLPGTGSKACGMPTPFQVVLLCPLVMTAPGRALGVPAGVGTRPRAPTTVPSPVPLCLQLIPASVGCCNCFKTWGEGGSLAWQCDGSRRWLAPHRLPQGTHFQHKWRRCKPAALAAKRS